MFPCIDRKYHTNNAIFDNAITIFINVFHCFDRRYHTDNTIFDNAITIFINVFHCFDRKYHTNNAIFDNDIKTLVIVFQCIDSKYHTNNAITISVTVFQCFNRNITQTILSFIMLLQFWSVCSNVWTLVNIPTHEVHYHRK